MTIHQQPTSFRADVEGLRAIAALMVLVYHLGGHWLGGGFSGVRVLRQGRIKDTPVGELRSIFSNGEKTERVLLQITPASVSKDETDGTVYFSKLLKD